MDGTQIPWTTQPLERLTYESFQRERKSASYPLQTKIFLALLTHPTPTWRPQRIVNHNTKWSNTIFSVGTTEVHKHNHHCSTENEIFLSSFPPFQESRTPNEVIHHVIYWTSCLHQPDANCKWEQWYIPTWRLHTWPKKKNKGNSMMSRGSSIKCREGSIYSFVTILSAKAECMCPPRVPSSSNMNNT